MKPSPFLLALDSCTGMTRECRVIPPENHVPGLFTVRLEAFEPEFEIAAGEMRLRIEAEIGRDGADVFRRTLYFHETTHFRAFVEGDDRVPPEPGLAEFFVYPRDAEADHFQLPQQDVCRIDSRLHFFAGFERAAVRFPLHRQDAARSARVPHPEERSVAAEPAVGAVENPVPFKHVPLADAAKLFKPGADRREALDAEFGFAFRGHGDPFGRIDNEELMVDNEKRMQPQEEIAMSTLVKDIVVPKNRHIDIELPADVPEGEATITITVEPGRRVNRLGELYGSGKGELVWMADDFDAPLEDFKEYM